MTLLVNPFLSYFDKEGRLTPIGQQLMAQLNLLFALDADALAAGLATKQDTLVSGSNIKTVNGESLLGPGNLEAVPVGGATGDVLTKVTASDYDLAWVAPDNGGAVVLSWMGL